MKKVFDQTLAEDIGAIISECDDPDDAALEVVEFLRNTQDAGGMKVCQHDNQ